LTIDTNFDIIYKMIKYDWERLNNYYRWEESQVLKYFYFRAHINMPTFLGKNLTKKEVRCVTRFNTGFSFLINPIPLLLDNSSVTDMYEYIQIASLRSLFDYKIRGVDWVYEWQLPKEINLNNPLITMKQGRIYLKYDSKITGD